MPDVSSNQPADVRRWVALDVHKLSIVAATLPPSGGQPELSRIETTRVAIRRFIERLGLQPRLHRRKGAGLEEGSSSRTTAQTPSCSVDRP